MAVLSEVQFTPISQAATATLVAAQGAGAKVRVVGFFLVSTSANTLTFKSGAAGTALTGGMALAANGQLSVPFNPEGWFETAANALLELSLSGATQVSGSLAWVSVS